MPLTNPGAPPTIAALPAAPTRTETGAVFSNKAATFVGAMDPFGDDVDAVGVWMKSAADFCEQEANTATAAQSSASASASSASASAASAINSPGTQATSTSSITPAIGSVAFTLAQTGKSFVVGQFVNIADATTPTTKFLRGAITAFTPGTGAMTVTVTDYLGGVGTNWVVTQSSPQSTYGIWQPAIVVSGTSQAMVTFQPCVFTNTGAQSTGTLPASPVAGDKVRFDNATNRFDLSVARNGKNIMGLAQDLTVDQPGAFTMEYVDATRGWRFI